MKKRERGFTLVEVVMVVAIIGGLIVVAVPAWMGFQKSMQLREAARTIASAYRFARSEAVAKNREHRVIIQAQQKRYRVVKGSRANNSSSTAGFDWNNPPAANIVRDWSPITSRPADSSLNLKTGGTSTTNCCTSTGDVSVEFNTNGGMVNPVSSLIPVFVCVFDGGVRSWRVYVQNPTTGRIVVDR